MSRSVVSLLAVAALAVVGNGPTPVADADDLRGAVTWLEKEAHRLIRASRRTMKDGTAAFPPQAGSGYEAFWLRDFAYTLEGSAGSYLDEELREAARLFVRSMRPDGAGVDCVKFNGEPIYQPGYGTMGANPVADGSQFTVAVAWHTYQRTSDQEFLREVIDELVRTMHAVPRNPKTGLVHIKSGTWDRCPYGFTDTVRMEGDLLFCSLLYVEAGHRLSSLLRAVDREGEAADWQAKAEAAARSIREVLWDPKAGLFRAATVRCREHHIWGSAFAVYVGVADESQSLAIARSLRDNYARIVQRGQIRHLPGGVYWEDCLAGRDTYQNGAYWATPAGWFAYTLDLVDPPLADRTITDLVADFRRGGACEWVFGEQRRLPHYLASACLPLAGVRGMIARREAGAPATHDRSEAGDSR